jgi:hypothetical protein
MVPILLCSEFEIHFTFFLFPKQFFVKENFSSGKHSVVVATRLDAVFSAPLNGRFQASW